MPKIIFIQHDGTTQAVEGSVGQSVMEAATTNFIPGVIGECGGCCSCATCHVYVDPGWGGKLVPATDEEDRMLDEAYQVQENSRLSCQLTFSEELDGLKVTLAPEF